MEVIELLSFSFVLTQGEVKSFCIPGSYMDNCYTLFL